MGGKCKHPSIQYLYPLVPFRVTGVTSALMGGVHSEQVTSPAEETLTFALK